MQFGKTAAALASLLAAGTCAAAGVKVYGAIDTGLSVGFILENGSSSDSGALGKDGSIFNRESQIYLKTRFGTSRLA